MAKKTSKSTASKPKADLERDDIAVKVASGLCHLSSRSNVLDCAKVAENAYGVADALLAHRSK